MTSDILPNISKIYTGLEQPGGEQMVREFSFVGELSPNNITLNIKQTLRRPTVFASGGSGDGRIVDRVVRRDLLWNKRYHGIVRHLRI